MSDYGIVISDKGNDVNKLVDVIFTTKYPMAKIDSTNPVAFQDILLTFINDPPEPAAGTSNKTLVYSFTHGYKYKPSHWSLINIVSPVTSNYQQDYFQEVGIVSQQSVVDFASFSVEMTNTNVNLYINKTTSGVSFNNLTGLALRIRLYVFVEDIGL